TGTRVAALQALGVFHDENTDRATRLALDDADPRVRAEGRRLLAKSDPQAAVAALGKALEDGTLTEKQSALATLGEMTAPEADASLEKGLDRLLAKDYPAELQLDLLD